MDVGVVELALTVGVLDTWGRDSVANVMMPTYY